MVSRQSPVSTDHYAAFGAIVYHFACFERLVEICIAHILGARHGVTALAISGLQYTAKTEALKSLIGIHRLPDGYAETIKKALGDFKGYNGLRNNIAHHVWWQGLRPNSIRVMRISSRGGCAEVYGVRDDDKDYTLDEFIDIADKLADINAKFTDYLVETGIIEKADFGTDDTSASSSSRSPIPQE